MIVLGADTHKRSHTIAAVSAATGELMGEQTVQVGAKSFGALVLWARAMPRSYQVTPGHPDRRRATQRKPVRPITADSVKSEPARRRSGPSPQRRTSTTAANRTASVK
jgi:hypothetical protein